MMSTTAPSHHRAWLLVPWTKQFVFILWATSLSCRTRPWKATRTPCTAAASRRRGACWPPAPRTAPRRCGTAATGAAWPCCSSPGPAPSGSAASLRSPPICWQGQRMAAWFFGTCSPWNPTGEWQILCFETNIVKVVCCTSIQLTYTTDGYHKETGIEFRWPKDLSMGEG